MIIMYDGNRTLILEHTHPNEKLTAETVVKYKQLRHMLPMIQFEVATVTIGDSIRTIINQIPGVAACDSYVIVNFEELPIVWIRDLTDEEVKNLNGTDKWIKAVHEKTLEILKSAQKNAVQPEQPNEEAIKNVNTNPNETQKVTPITGMSVENFSVENISGETKL